MTYCERCNGYGYIALNGDDDTICPECGGMSEMSEAVAVQEPLSELAQLRIDLDRFDELFCTVHPDSDTEVWERFTVAQDKMYDNPDEKYHLLFDEIDRLQAENKRMSDFMDSLSSKYINTTPMNIQDIWRIGEILCRERFSSVVDSEGKHISCVSVDLRTGNFSILRTWHVEGFMKRDVIVVQSDYVVTVTEKQGEATR